MNKILGISNGNYIDMLLSKKMFSFKISNYQPLTTYSTASHVTYWCTFQILGGCQGRRTGVGVTTVSNSLILGGWVTKVLKNGDKKQGEGGGGVGDNNILTFSSYCTKSVSKVL